MVKRGSSKAPNGSRSKRAAKENHQGPSSASGTSGSDEGMAMALAAPKENSSGNSGNQISIQPGRDFLTEYLNNWPVGRDINIPNVEENDGTATGGGGTEMLLSRPLPAAPIPTVSNEEDIDENKEFEPVTDELGTPENTEKAGGDLLQEKNEDSAEDKESNGNKETKCKTMGCPESQQGCDSTFLNKCVSYTWKLATFFRKKESPQNPLDILLSRSQYEIAANLHQSWSTMNGAYKSLYLWDEKELGLMMSIPDIVTEVAAKSNIKVFALEVLHTELIMKDEFQRINDTIGQAIRHSALAPCILFIERIDRLMYSLEPPALSLVNHNLHYLFLHPVLFVATSTRPCDSINIQRMFLNHKVVQLRRPTKEDTMELFSHAFMKHPHFARRVAEVQRQRLLKPIYYYCLDCLKTVFGQKFFDDVNNILEVCNNRTAPFILHVYGILKSLTEEKEFQNLDLEHYFENLGVKINEWKIGGMPLAIKLYDF